MYDAHDLNDRRFAAVAVVLDQDAKEFYFQALSAVVSDIGVSHRTVGQLLSHVSRFVDSEIQRLSKCVEQEILAMPPKGRLELDSLVVDVARGDPQKSRTQKRAAPRR